MGSLAALAGDLALLGRIHRRESAIFLCHGVLLQCLGSRTAEFFRPGRPARGLLSSRTATDVPAKSLKIKGLPEGIR
jgi:hypothetical protein